LVILDKYNNDNDANKDTRTETSDNQLVEMQKGRQKGSSDGISIAAQ